MENKIELVEIDYQGKHITLIPTAHVSKESAQLVADTIDAIQPDCICIELDEGRYNTLTDPDKYRQTNITQIIKEKKTGFMLANMILANYQKKMAKQLGNEGSGREMLVGIDKSKQLDVPLVLADRNIQTTFKRVWANLGFKDKINLLSEIFSSIGDDEEITEEDILKLQQSDALQQALAEVSEQYPKITEVLVDERDMYLTYKVKTAPGNNIVAILGAAHTVGMQKYFDMDYSIEELDEVPPKSTLSKVLKWLIPAIIVIAIITSFSFDSELGLSQIKKWVLINGTLSALGTLIAGGHLLSVLVAFIAAPITSLNPLLAAGWFAGLCEAHLTKPTVEDFNNISDDLTSFKGLTRNKVTRILLIVIMANLGSTIGTFIGGLDIFSSLFNRI